ncbi:hypothetical protein KX816_07795 [Sphingosinicellaceae bacterium]|nr:hypothetical protein KX816_07795 [Sphingosinicellaceae bacterium]
MVIELLRLGKRIKQSDDVVDKARLRRDIGNPPGKSNSLGDQMNWESLINEVPEGNDIHIVTRDGDYSSKVDKLLPSRIIEREWYMHKKSSVLLYNSLGQFAKRHFPEIKFPKDVIKNDAINKLVNATNFTVTHSAIETLDDAFDEINSDDAIRIFRAAIDNSQVHWIIDDSDVSNFMKKLYTKFFVDVPFEMDAELDELSDYFKAPF